MYKQTMPIAPIVVAQKNIRMASRVMSLARRARGSSAGVAKTRRRKRPGGPLAATVSVTARHSLTGAPGPSGMPSRYQMAKNTSQVMATQMATGIISETTVPSPESFL